MESLKDKKVLVVDNDEMSVYLANIYLDDMGISGENIVVAVNGIEAVEKAKKELFDIILMDIRMPGMDGIKASQEIKSHYDGNSPKIVAYTADVFAVKDPKIDIMDGVVIKPVNKEKFQKMILDVLVAKILEKTPLDKITVGD